MSQHPGLRRCEACFAIDIPQGLESEVSVEAEVIPDAPQRERCAARRGALVEDEDLSVRIAAELQREEREQDRLAGAGRPDHHHVPDISLMGDQPERRRTGRARHQERRAGEMRIALRSCPERRQWRHMGKIDRVQQRLADIGIGFARQRAEPGLDRIDAFRDASEPAPPDHALDSADLVLCNRSIRMPNHNCRRTVSERDMARAKRL